MAESPKPTSRAVAVGMTDVGRVREHNEDSFLVMNRADGKRVGNAEKLEVALDGAILLVVCDGMGGAAAGEVASRMAADRMGAELGAADLATATPDRVAALMEQAVQKANVDIHEAAKANPSQKGMGTTMTAAVVTPERLYVSQVGDSRAYLLRKSEFSQITQDQSLIAQLIAEGTLTEEEAEKLGGRNIVLQAVGVEENLRVDTKHWPVLRGDVLLLCSDGLSGMVKDREIKEILVGAGGDVAKAAEGLVAEANKNGGRDNVTAIVARFEGDGLRAPLETSDGASAEKGGVAFQSPSPPPVENATRRLAWLVLAFALLAAALWFALSRGAPEKKNGAAPADKSARVSIECAQNGAKVEAFDERGTLLAEASLESGRASLAVAPGKVLLRVTKPGCETWKTETTAAATGETKLPPVQLKQAPTPVILDGPAGAEYYVYRQKNEGWEYVLGGRLSDKGESAPHALGAGSYEFRRRAGDATVATRAAVAAGETEKRIRLESSPR